MIPYILAAVGGYFIGDSVDDKQVFADGGNISKEKYQVIGDGGKYASIGMNGKIKWSTSSEWGYVFSKEEAERFAKYIKDSTGIEDVEVVQKMAMGGGIMYKDLAKEKPLVVNDSIIESKKFKIDEVDLYRKSKKSFETNPIIRSSADAVNLFREFWDEQSLSISENANIMFLNRANRVIALYQHSKGGVTGTVLEPEMIVLAAVKSLAKGVIIAHNHPSGNLTPSDSDIRISRQIKEALKLVDISLLDSLIITENAYYSFMEEGVLKRGGKINSHKKQFLKDVKDLHEDIAEITLTDGTKVSGKELMEYGHPKMAKGGIATDKTEYVVIRIDKKPKTLADFKNKKEALDFIYNYKLSYPRAKLDYFKFADGGMVSQTRVGTIETKDFDQHSGTLKNMFQQNNSLYATVTDDDGIERTGIVTEIFHFEIDENEKVIEIDEALMIFLKKYNYLLDRHINFIKPNLYFVYYDELNDIERKELGELLGDDLTIIYND